MSPRLFIAATLVALLSHAGAARADLRQEIEAANAALIKHYAAKDAKTVAGLYTTTARVIAPGAEIAAGREAIATYWQGAIDSGLVVLTLETIDVEAAGDTAYELGKLRLRNPDGSEGVARYVVVWKRVDGAWKLHRDIWN
jgi:ketosteroid isomerase-like protein